MRLRQEITGVGIVSKDQATQYIIDNGGSESTAQTVAGLYQESQLSSLRVGMFFVFACLLGSFVLSKQLPSKVVAHKK